MCCVQSDQVRGRCAAARDPLNWRHGPRVASVAGGRASPAPTRLGSRARSDATRDGGATRRLPVAVVHRGRLSDPDPAAGGRPPGRPLGQDPQARPLEGLRRSDHRGPRRAQPIPHSRRPRAEARDPLLLPDLRPGRRTDRPGEAVGGGSALEEGVRGLHARPKGAQDRDPHPCEGAPDAERGRRRIGREGRRAQPRTGDGRAAAQGDGRGPAGRPVLLGEQRHEALDRLPVLRRPAVAELGTRARGRRRLLPRVAGVPQLGGCGLRAAGRRNVHVRRHQERRAGQPRARGGGRALRRPDRDGLAPPMEPDLEAVGVPQQRRGNVRPRRLAARRAGPLAVLRRRRHRLAHLPRVPPPARGLQRLQSRLPRGRPDRVQPLRAAPSDEDGRRQGRGERVEHLRAPRRALGRHGLLGPHPDGRPMAANLLRRDGRRGRPR